MQPLEAFEHVARSGGGLVALTFFAGAAVTHSTIASVAQAPDSHRRMSRFLKRWFGPAVVVMFDLAKAYSHSTADLRPLWPWLGLALALGVPARLVSPPLGRALGLPKLSEWLAGSFHLLADVTTALLKPVWRTVVRIASPIVQTLANVARALVAPVWRTMLRIARALPRPSASQVAIGMVITVSIGLVVMVAVSIAIS
jgi:hypothetical protein